MEKYELPLVIFTVLSQMSVGITLILTLRVLQGNSARCRLHTGRRGVRRALLRAGVLSTFPGAGQHCDRNERRTERLRFAAVKLRQTTLSLRRLMSASNSAE